MQKRGQRGENAFLCFVAVSGPCWWALGQLWANISYSLIRAQSNTLKRHSASFDGLQLEIWHATSISRATAFDDRGQGWHIDSFRPSSFFIFPQRWKKAISERKNVCERIPKLPLLMRCRRSGKGGVSQSANLASQDSLHFRSRDKLSRNRRSTSSPAMSMSERSQLLHTSAAEPGSYSTQSASA